MFFTSALALSLGASIANAILKAWLGDSPLTGILGAAVDTVKGQVEKTLGNVPDQRRIEQVGAQVAARLWPIFQQEAAGLTRDDRNVVVVEVAATLAQAQIDADLLVACRLDPQRLAEHLKAQRPDAARDLSTDQAALYRRTLVEISREIMAIASDLTGFTGSLAAAQLQDDRALLDLVERLVRAPDEAAARFARAYADEVIRRLDRMERFGIPHMDEITRLQRLSVAYITLQAVPADLNRSSKHDRLLLRMLAQQEDPHLQLKDDAAPPEWRNGPVDQVLALARRIVVRGDAGSGKSTLLQWLAVRSAAGDFPAHLASWHRTIPFYIRLRERVEKGFPQLEDIPAMVAHTVAGGKPVDWVYQQFDSGRAVALIDGVDELPQAQRAAMLEELKGLVAQFPLARYIISSRPSALKEWPEWAEWIEQAEFADIVLQPMTQAQVERFVDQWHRALAEVVPADEREDLAELPANLLRLLRDRPPLRRLADTPLLCAIICALHRDRRQQLPAERVKLYEECVEMLLERRDFGRQISLGVEYPNLAYAQKIALIQSLAYEMQSEGASIVAHDWVDNHFKQFLPLFSLAPDVTEERIRKFFVGRTGLLREPIEGHVDFAHRTFQEFLAARAAAHNRRIGTLLQHADDDRWRETIILAAGMTNHVESDRLLLGLIAGDPLARLKGIVARKTAARQQHIRRIGLALACLETCVTRSQKVRAEVLQRAAPLFPPQNDEEARLLTVAGEDIIPRLRINPNHSGREAAACIAALAAIGGDSALDAIAGYAGDERAAVDDALAAAWRSFDPRAYAARVLHHYKKLSLSGIDSLEGFDLLLSLIELDVSGTQVQDLSPLAQLPSLTELDLRGTQVQDLSPLAQLPSLTKLYLSGTPVQDLRPLAQLPSLIKLSLDGTQVQDLSPLAQLPSLTELDLSRTSVQDLSPLAQLPSLTTLYLSSTQVQDLRPLAQLPSLTVLNVSGTPVQDLRPLAQLPSLTVLNVSGTQVQDLSPLAQLPSLTELSLGGTQVLDLRPLAQLPSLTELDLRGTLVLGLSPLAQLPSLTTLYLFGTQVLDLSPLAQLPSLTTLYLSSTQVLDLSPLAQLPSLTRLYLISMQVPNLRLLAQLPSLTRLYLIGMQVPNLRPLAQLSSLTTLYLSSTQVQDLRPLAQLLNLTELNLSGTQVQDLRPLAQLTSLTELDLSRTPVQDLSVLAQLTSLTELNIEYTNVRDISPLKELKNLTRLRR